VTGDILTALDKVHGFYFTNGTKLKLLLHATAITRDYVFAHWDRVLVLGIAGVLELSFQGVATQLRKLKNLMRHQVCAQTITITQLL
jgi:hypothetical protein